ncbi:MAG TPA: glycosyltransferase, partial [Candidatus Thioglobus sp.]|nr:glycosyltransferase [Candidatus Thioglobus sp.]
MARVLYITYDGLMEPLGMSQVWQYLKVLSKNNNITIISFEKSADLLDKDRLSCLCNEVDSYGVSWRRLKYHKTPSIMATAYDIVRGILLGVFIVKKSKIEIIHARSYVPALVALVINKLLNIKFIFDMRGFWADEKVDGEAWSKNSLVYKITKKLECSFLTNASSIVSLTNIGRNDVLSLDCMKNTRKKIVVIPTCVNLQLF